MIPPVLEKNVPPIKIKTPIPENGPIKLNLGGAGEGMISGKVPGFMIVDLRDVDDTDIVSDINNLSMFKDNSVDEIYCSNALEHFPHTETITVLKEWNRVLKPGAKCYISVPDLEASFKLFQKIGLTDWVKYLIWGDQAHPLNYHYINFTYSSLAKDLYHAGFSDTQRVQSFPHGIKDASEHKDNILKIRISLNVVAVK